MLVSALVGTIVEEIRRVPDVVAVGFPCGRRFPRKLQFIYEHLAIRYIFNVLHDLTIQVRDVATAAQVVGVVVELHLFVGVLVMEVVICLGPGFRH